MQDNLRRWRWHQRSPVKITACTIPRAVPVHAIAVIVVSSMWSALTPPDRAWSIGQVLHWASLPTSCCRAITSYWRNGASWKSRTKWSSLRTRVSNVLSISCCRVRLSTFHAPFDMVIRVSSLLKVELILGISLCGHSWNSFESLSWFYESLVITWAKWRVPWGWELSRCCSYSVLVIFNCASLLRVCRTTCTWAVAERAWFRPCCICTGT